MRRREFITMLGGAAPPIADIGTQRRYPRQWAARGTIWPLAARAQQPNGIGEQYRYTPLAEVDAEIHLWHIADIAHERAS